MQPEKDRPRSQTLTEYSKIESMKQSLTFATSAIIGVNDYERVAEQGLIVSIEVDHKSPENPPLLEELTEQMAQRMSLKKPFLLERLALDLLKMTTDQLSGLKEVVLTIKKPQALAKASYSYVRLRAQL